MGFQCCDVVVFLLVVQQFVQVEDYQFDEQQFCDVWFVVVCDFFGCQLQGVGDQQYCQYDEEIVQCGIVGFEVDVDVFGQFDVDFVWCGVVVFFVVWYGGRVWV